MGFVMLVSKSSWQNKEHEGSAHAALLSAVGSSLSSSISGDAAMTLWVASTSLCLYRSLFIIFGVWGITFYFDSYTSFSTAPG